MISRRPSVRGLRGPLASLAVLALCGVVAAQGFTSGYATEVISSNQGSGASSTPPENALGSDPSTYFHLGYGGQLTVAFENFVCNSGDSQPDLCVWEVGNNTCYFICLRPANAETVAALIAAGVPQFGEFFEQNTTYCGNYCLDIDDIVPGNHLPGSLVFDHVMIVAPGDANPKISKLRADFQCTPGTPDDCADVIVAYAPGTTAHDSDPTEVLGAPDGDWSRIGSGGCITLAVEGKAILNDGTSAADLVVYEVEGDVQPDDYWLDVDPADAATLAAVQAAGLALQDGFYRVGLFVGLEAIDLDAAVPGYAAGALRFEAVRICDKPGGPDGSAEIDAVCFSNTGPALAKIGDRAWEDLDRDGIQDEGEPGLPGVLVTLLDENGQPTGLTATTDAQGFYQFCVEPGSYVICFAGIWGFERTLPGEGGDAGADSDAGQADGKTPIVTVGAGEERDDVDGGYVCIQASSDPNFPACGLPLDPVLTATPPIAGGEMVVTLTSAFPNAPTFGFLSLGPPIPNLIAGSPCTVWLDLANPDNFIALWADLTDAAGGYQGYFPIPVLPNINGIQLTIQARVCEPAIPGPIPGTPDWVSNAVGLTIGCP